MRRVVLLALNDIRVTLRDRASFIWMLAFPVALMWFLGVAMGDPGGVSRISLPVLDQDGGWLAEALIEELDGDQVSLERLPAVPDEPPLRMLVIPPGFTEGVLAGEAQTLRFELSGRASPSFSLAAETRIRRVTGRVLGRLAALGPESDSAEVETRRRFELLGARPAAVGLRVTTIGSGVRVPTGFAQTVPGILTMTVFMMKLIYGGSSLAQERRQGMLRRQAGLPMTRNELILGKILGRLFVAVGQIAMLLLTVVLLRGVFDLDFGSSPAGLILVLVSLAFAAAGLSTFFGAVVSSPEQAEGFGWIAGMVIAAAGGCWWPLEVMPEWMQTVVRIFPTAWAMDALHQLISYGRGLESVLGPSAVLIGFGAVFSYLAARYLRFD